MHADEVETNVDLVRTLVCKQFPQWAKLSVIPVDSFGTDHDIYRLGDELCVRLPAATNFETHSSDHCVVE